jgi:hypothetical protein
MDFISDIPKVKDMISIFAAPPKACLAEEFAGLFYKNVVKYFGILKDIINDRDTRFTGRFWTTLFKMLGLELKFSMTDYSQTEG